MKLAILVALLATSVTAVPCDPTKISYKYFTDDKCTKLDEETTKGYGKPDPSQYHEYEPGCQNKDIYSYKLDCDAYGIHQRAFSGPDCKTPVEEWNEGGLEGNIVYVYNACEKARGADVYMITFSEQTFTNQQEQGMSSDMMNDEQYMKQVQKFDQHFYYAIDHMNAEPGSTVNSCSATNQCTQSNDKHCCVNAFMSDPMTKKEYSIYRCMNEQIADANYDITIEGVKISMKCLGKSAAMSKFAAATATTMVSLAAMTLY